MAEADGLCEYFIDEARYVYTLQPPNVHLIYIIYTCTNLYKYTVSMPSPYVSMHLAAFVKAQVATLMMAWFRHWVPDSDSAVPLGPKIYDVGVGTVRILRVLPITVKAAS